MATKDRSKVKQTASRRSGKDNARWIVGLLIAAVGFFATLSILSYYFTWKSDFSIMQGGEQGDIRNICGPWGGYMGFWLVSQSFGVFGIVAAVMTFFLGVRIIRRRPFLFNHSTLSCMMILILGSLTLGLAFGENWGMFGTGWGGAFGVFVAGWLQSKIGIVGAAIVIIVGWILTGVFINSNFINTMNDLGNSVGSLYGRVRESISHAADKSTGTETGTGGEESEGYDEYEKESPVVPPAPEPEGRRAEPAEPVEDTPGTDPRSEQVVTVNDIYARRLTDETTPEPADKDEEGEIVYIDNSDDDDETPADNGPEGRRIIVEEHEEVQVDLGDIDTLYDPTKDIYNYQQPSPELLTEYASNSRVTDDEIASNTRQITETLANFGIPIRDIKATVGPTVTLYEILQEQGVKIARIRGLENDIAQSLKALGIRIIAPIPGRGTIGIEVPNRNKEIVSMRSAVLSERFQQFKAELPVVIGRTIQNENYVFDLAKMPHLLVAGATGQGKSVGLNAIITSLLYRKHPSQLKFVLIDPKMVEFSLYSRLERHFLAKMESEEEAIVTDPKKAVFTLNALCVEMGNRLELCKKAGARNIVEYNEKFLHRRLKPTDGHSYMPYIVVIIDEFADLIITAKEVETPVMRLAQKARAVGIHLIVATQRPDVRVITGGIKANFPARIAFRVQQMTDSRTIIDQPGANQLIGRGDMLLSNGGDLTRIQCALVETDEVEKIVDCIATQNGYSSAYPLPDYEEAGNGGEAGLGSGGADLGGAPVKYDMLFAEIARDAVTSGQISTSYIQRNYEVGFNRAGRIMTQLEKAGIVGPQIGAKQRDIKFYDLPSLNAKLQELGIE